MSVATLILEFLLIMLDLLRGFINGRVGRRHQIRGLSVADKFVFVFCCRNHFNFLIQLLKIDRDIDHGESIEEMQQLVGLLRQLCLFFDCQLPMPG